jgi:hypothetical protein
MTRKVICRGRRSKGSDLNARLQEEHNARLLHCFTSKQVDVIRIKLPEYVEHKAAQMKQEHCKDVTPLTYCEFQNEVSTRYRK